MIEHIYAIRNDVNSFLYIGRTNMDLSKRFISHVGALKNGKHTSAAMQRDFDLFGQGKFRIELIEDVDSKNVAEIERYWIMKFYATGNLYNELIPIREWKTDLYRGWIEKVTGVFDWTKTR